MKMESLENPRDVANHLAAAVSLELEQALQQRGEASLAVPGGNTPVQFLRALSECDMEWARVRITTTDERRVPPEHARSNARLLRSNLLQNAAASALFFPLNSNESQSALDEMIKEHFLPMDVCVLGMGDDGHTASLFPGVSPHLLDPEVGPAVEFVQPPGDLEPRISLTAYTLLKAHHLHVLIHGPTKAEVLARARDGDSLDEMPIRTILQHAADRLVIHHART